MKHFLTMGVLGILWLGRAVAAEETAELDRLLDEVGDRLGGCKTWIVDYSQTVNMTGSEMTMSGQVKFRSSGEMRLELTMSMMNQPGTTTVVTDRDGVLWQDMNMAGERRVIKVRLSEALGESGGRTRTGGNPFKDLDPREQLKQMRTMYDLTILPAPELHEQPMHVLEGTVKESATTNQQARAMAQMVGKTRFYIGQKDGFFHKIQTFGKSGEAPVMTQELRNVQTNVELADELFRYTPPDGVQVVDMTEMMKQMHGGTRPAPPPPAAQPPAATPPAPAPAEPPATAAPAE